MPKISFTPNSIPNTIDDGAPMMFLAGSIEQGKAANWQQEAIDYYFSQPAIKDMTIFNPRVHKWNANLEQVATNPEFRWQVTSELQHIERADAVIMWLEPGTLSPISLLELGLLCGSVHAGRQNKLVIGCPDGFWRKGNVDIVAERYGVPVVSSLSEMLFDGYELMKQNFFRRRFIGRCV